MNNKKDDIFKFLYFNKNIIHKILYYSEKIIQINSDIIKNDLSEYFYLILLLKDNPNIINYEYTIEEIQNINNQLNNENNNLFKKLIISLLILELIRNFKEMDSYDEEKNEKELQIIENNIIAKINYYIDELKELDLNLDSNRIKVDKIDKIYIGIINSLITNNKINDYDYFTKIMNQIDIENINITKNMLDELSTTLNINEDYINKYLIIEKSDLQDERNINFYYILFKYILKSQIYIYQIPFLLELRKNILKIIELDKITRNQNNSNEMDKKLEYIIKFISDSEFYINNIEYNSLISILSNNQESDSSSLSITNSKLSINNYFSKMNNNENIKKINENQNNFYFSYKSSQDISERTIIDTNYDIFDTKYYRINKKIEDFTIEKILKKSSKYEIIQFIKIIYLNKNKEKPKKIKTIEFFKNIKNNNNNFYLCGGINNPISFYNIFFVKMGELDFKIPKNSIYSIYEFENNKILFLKKMKYIFKKLI